MKKHLISILAILLVSVFILSSCEIPDLGGSDDAFIEHLQGQIDELKNELSEAKNENKEKDKEIANLKAEMSALRAEIASLQALDTENKGKIAALEADYAAKVAELEANKQANEEALAALKAEYEAAIEALNAENADLALQIKDLEERIQELLDDKDYTVTFDVNGGVGEVASQTIKYKKTVNEPTVPAKEYYDFAGWYVNGEKAEFPYVVTYDTDFVAHYTPTKYTITYNVNGGTMPESYVTEYNVETGVTLPTPTRSLYLFDGWYEDDKFEGAKVTSIPVGEVGNKTYYAKWLSTTDGITYQLTNNGTTYTVTGYEGKDTVIVIPSSIDGIPVTAIAQNAFKDKQRITSITIPDSVTSIGDYAFYGCISLTELNLGNGIKTIPGYMAYGCNKLQSIVIPDSVTTIGSYAFYYCSSLVSVVIGDSVTSIGSQAFYYCDSLVSVVIGDSVTSIGQYAFYGCSSLYVVYNNSDLLIKIGITNNGYLAYNAKVLVDNGETIYRNDGYNYTLTKDGFLFREKDSKYELISYIGGEDTVTLPDDINGNSYDLYYMRGVVNVIIPESFTTINDEAFAYCYSLVSVVIPDSVTSIGGAAFRNCSRLRSVVIGDSVEFIGQGAFYDCSSLVSVTIPDSVTSIGLNAFRYCFNLESVVIGDSVEFIGECAFESCSSLGEIYYNGSAAEWNSIYIYPYSNEPLERATCYYYSEEEPCEEGNFWHWVDGEVVIWPDYVEPELISTPDEYFEFTLREDGTYSIKAKDVNNMPSEVVIPSTYNGKAVTSIGNYAFASCSSLESVTIPNSVKFVGNYAFQSCSSLESVVIGDSVITIGNYAFASCSSLTEVYYNGSASEWNRISINSSGNASLKNATRYYYSETKPTTGGNFWHWVDGEVAIWE